jgi:hypothetical protein
MERSKIRAFLDSNCFFSVDISSKLLSLESWAGELVGTRGKRSSGVGPRGGKVGRGRLKAV